MTFPGLKKSVSAVVVLSTAAALAGPAHSVQLPFSPDCRQYVQIDVTAPDNIITFTKVPIPFLSGTATIYNITADENIIIGDGQALCYINVAPPNSDRYCFIARDDARITNVSADAEDDPDDIPLCQ